MCQCQDLPFSAISVVRIERDIFRSLENTHSFMKQLKEGDKEDSVYVIIFFDFFCARHFVHFSRGFHLHFQLAMLVRLPEGI